MRHQRMKKRLGLKTAPRMSLLANLGCQMAKYGRIETTIDRARTAQRFVDKLITTARTNDLHTRRELIRALRCPEAADTYLTEIATSVGERKGGYTRLIYNRRRKGDSAQMVLLEFTDTIKRKESAKPKKEKKKKVVAAETHDEPETKKKKKSEPVESITQPTHEPSDTSADTGDTEKEKPKKGGFLSGLRKFLKGDE